MRNLKASILIGGVVLSALSASAQAEITVLDKNPQSNALLAPLSLQVGGASAQSGFSITARNRVIIKMVTMAAPVSASVVIIN